MIQFKLQYSIILCVFAFFGAAQADDRQPPAEGTSSDTLSAATTGTFFTALEGDWRGSYSLWLTPDSPAEISDIKANFRSIAGGYYSLMTYSWKKGDQPHDGVFLFGGNGGAATASWGDSFHMLPEPMHCWGELQEDGNGLVVTGSYSVGSGLDWGWRTEFLRLSANQILMQAYNITPGGAEALAVKAELQRVMQGD